MLERVLIPLDGSVLAESALVPLRRLLERRKIELLLLRVVTLPPETEADAGEPLDLLWSRATEYVQNVTGRLSADGLRVRGRVVEGFPAREILRVAKAEGVGLIAMSTHGRTGLARWVFGSVTEKVLRASPVPVLAVPSFAGAGGEAFVRGQKDLPFKTIVAPLAPADSSLEILPALAEFAGLFGSTVWLLNVCQGVECSVPVPEVREAYDRLRKAGIAAEPIVKQGDPADRILETCRERGADLVAMATHGRSGVSRWLRGSVAEKVLRGANVPLLVVRSTPRKRGGDREVSVLDFHSAP